MENSTRYHDAVSNGYDDVFGMLIYRVLDAITWRFLEPYVPTAPDGLALDAGGGTGRWAARMAAKGCHVILMDVSEGMLSVASKRIQKENLQGRMTIQKRDMTDTGYAPESFDLVFCEHVLFLLDKPDAALAEFMRVLKKGGWLVVSVARAYTPDEFRALLESNGFHVEKIVGKGLSMPYSRFERPVHENKLLGGIARQDLGVRVRSVREAGCAGGTHAGNCPQTIGSCNAILSASSL